MDTLRRVCETLRTCDAHFGNYLSMTAATVVRILTS